MVSPANEEQEDYWNKQAGPKWVELQSFIDAQLQDLGAAAMDRLGPIDGATVLDVGCGCGTTTIQLAGRVGETGAVVGIDLSGPMLERARETARASGIRNATFQQADAQVHSFSERFGAVFSRFGVMFFAEPEKAFANLRGAMREDGVLSFVCWRSIDQNDWMIVPLRAALEHLPTPPIPDPNAPGPFAFADADRVRRILTAAGFAGIEVDRHDSALQIGKGRPLAEIVRIVMQMGPTSRLLGDAAPPDLQARVAESIQTALQPYLDENGILMRGSTWMVRARRA